MAEIKLYKHNGIAYDKVKKTYELDERIAGIVHATGTGKTPIALSLVKDNPSSKFLYLLPFNGINEHVEEMIEEFGLDINRDFSNMEFMTYQKLSQLSDEEISSLDIDWLIFDEFHHIGAPIWESKIALLIETHPGIKIFGMTAYTVRSRGTIYERDMAEPDGQELFSNKIVSTYDIYDAWLDKVFPKLRYRSAHTKLVEFSSNMEAMLATRKLNDDEYNKYASMLKDIKRRITNAKSAKDIVLANIRLDGKYIYYCPAVSKPGFNDIDTIMAEVRSWFKDLIPEDKIVFYKTTSFDRKDGLINRKAFYNDKTLTGEDASDKLQIMFAINQYNEGIHAPNVNGVIMGRSTSSDIVFFEQLGRALSVREDANEEREKLRQYSIDELKLYAKKMNIIFKDDITKDDLIELIVAPIVIDLADNYSFIEKMENELAHRIETRKKSGKGRGRELSFNEYNFDIVMENHDIYEMLKYLRDRLMKSTFDEWFYFAQKYYETHGDLLIPSNFRTLNGADYDENGYALGTWIIRIRVAYNYRENPDVLKRFSIRPLSEEEIDRILSIGMIFNVADYQWLEMYKLAKNYSEHYGNLKVPNNFRTFDGITYDEEGFPLSTWLKKQRSLYVNTNNMNNLNRTISKERIEMLEQIGMVFDNIPLREWKEMFSLAKIYKKVHGNLDVPQKFKTSDGIIYDENGKNLRQWILSQRKLLSRYEGVPVEELTETVVFKISSLKSIGLVSSVQEAQWEEMFALAQNYYNAHGHLKIPASFKTINGVEYDEKGENLGMWISSQREAYNAKQNPDNKKRTKRKPLTQEKIERLLSIGMIFDYVKYQWDFMYDLAAKFFDFYGHLNINPNFTTSDGITEDENGYKLGLWISRQRKAYNNRLSPVNRGRNTLTPLTDEEVKKLSQIGMVFNFRKNKEEVIEIFKSYGVTFKKGELGIYKISSCELKAKILFLESLGEPVASDGSIHKIFYMSDVNMQATYGISKRQMLEKYTLEKAKRLELKCL